MHNLDEFCDYQERFRLAFTPADPALVAANREKLERARSQASPPKMDRLHLRFNAAGEISAGDIKAAFAAVGVSAETLAIRFFTPERVPCLISRGTDRDGQTHYDHGWGDCDLALKEHGFFPGAHSYAWSTFVTDLADCPDHFIYKNNDFSGAIAIYHKTCLYPMESSIGNQSNGFHYFLTSPRLALAGYVDDPLKTQKAYADYFKSDDYRRGYKR